MLRHHITHFFEYCKNSNFSNRSIESLECRLLEFNAFILLQAAPCIGHITYHHLIQFVADFSTPSPKVVCRSVFSPGEVRLVYALSK
ncbi:MAG: hypothetical protein ACOY90_21435 [Candidatus Zhuqueibacterota bacterium]